jgi:hypothetical protein
MSRVRVDLFAEDRSHEEFTRPLIQRLVAEEGGYPVIKVISAQGGHGRAVDEFKVYQRYVVRSLVRSPDLAVVVIDANCRGWNSVRAEIQAAVDPELLPPVVVGCPDPHVERWYMADPESFYEVVGASPAKERTKCDRDRYKALLSEAVLKGRNPPTLGGIEFAREIVRAMNLYRASTGIPSLRAFVNDVRDAARLLLRR